MQGSVFLNFTPAIIITQNVLRILGYCSASLDFLFFDLSEFLFGVLWIFLFPKSNATHFIGLFLRIHAHAHAHMQFIPISLTNLE